MWFFLYNNVILYEFIYGDGIVSTGVEAYWREVRLFIFMLCILFAKDLSHLNCMLRFLKNTRQLFYINYGDINMFYCY